jgi:hypothetical protein
MDGHRVGTVLRLAVHEPPAGLDTDATDAGRLAS